jgi:glutamine amidotransferase
MIAVIDYGRGNLFSLSSSLNFLGYKFKIVDEAKDLNLNFNKIILPGVGAFADAMIQLKKKGFIDKLQVLKEKQIPILGICLGMQLFASKSYEFIEYNGLNFIPGEVKKLQLNKKYEIPNMGWRKLSEVNNSEIQKIQFNKMVYFVHSFGFYPDNKEHIISNIHIGDTKIPAIVKKDNIIGMQFHPERSGFHGLNMLKWFLELIK